MSPLRFGLRYTWRWPTLGFCSSRPACQERLADRVGQRAIMAGEPARQVVEGGVIAAPLAHAVEALEDPARHAAHRVGVLVRSGRGARGLQQPQHLVLERLDRLVIQRRAAEARHGLRHPQRVRGADRLAKVRPTLQNVAGEQVRTGAQAVDPVLLELGIERLVRVFHRLGRVGRRVGQQEHPVELAEAQPQILARRAAGRARRPPPRARLPRRPAPPSARPPRRGRPAAPGVTGSTASTSLLGRRHGHGDRRLVSRAPLGQLARARARARRRAACEGAPRSRAALRRRRRPQAPARARSGASAMPGAYASLRERSLNGYVRRT